MTELYNSNPPIIFDDNFHSYVRYKTDIPIPYISVSTYVGEYKNKFNKEYWGPYKAYERLLGKDLVKSVIRSSSYPKEDLRQFEELNTLVKSEEFVATLQEVYAEWDESSRRAIDKGNAYHSFKEQQAITLGYSENPFTKENYPTIQSVEIQIVNGKEKRIPKYNSLYDIEDGFHPELILWNDIAKVAGQSDKVYIITKDDKRFAFIDDFKTNKTIKKTNPFQKMLAPLDHLDDCTYNHYRLQISFYAWMLEQAGFIIAGTSFTHLNNPHIFDYMKTEIESIIPDYLDI